MHAASEINNTKCMIKHLHFQCFCYCDLSKSLTVAVQLVPLHLFTWTQETVIHNSRFVLYIATVLVLYTYWRVITACYNFIHWVSYNSHESSSRRTLLTRLARPFLHIRSFVSIHRSWMWGWMRESSWTPVFPFPTAPFGFTGGIN